MQFSELRVRTRVPASQLDKVRGKVVTVGDSDVQLVGPARVLLPTGKPLCVYVPGVLADTPQDVLDTLHGIKEQTDQRMLASGSRHQFVGRMMRSKRVYSATVGYMEPNASSAGLGKTRTINNVCRLTSWTGKHLDQFQQLLPLVQRVSDLYREHVPNRWAVQRRYWQATPADFRIAGTVFTTLTVNNSYPTGVHKDAGDLDEGFSCLAVFRRGRFAGGHLTFPEWRVRVDMQHGDLLLMDAHQWHGNTALDLEPGAERVSVVAYYRTRMAKCPPLST